MGRRSKFVSAPGSDTTPKYQCLNPFCHGVGTSGGTCHICKSQLVPVVTLEKRQKWVNPALAWELSKKGELKRNKRGRKKRIQR